MLIAKAKSRIAQRELDRVLRRFEPRVARAFREAARNIRRRTTLRALSQALERGDIEGAIDIVGIERLGALLRGRGLEPGQSSMQDELIGAFREGGVGGARQLPRAAALGASLDLTNPEAVAYLRDHLPTLVREITEESREAIRQAVLRGFNEGRPAPEIAREIRESIGLTRQQQRAVGNLRRQLETGQLMRNAQGQVIETYPWNRRLSAVERSQARSMYLAAREGNPAAAARIDALVERYHESLVNRRARNVARTETHRAFIEGQQQIWNDATDRGLLDPQTTRRVWIVTPDDRLRASHAAIPRMNEGGVGLNEMFQTPFGPVMGPGDPVRDLINCRCSVGLSIDE